MGDAKFARTTHDRLPVGMGTVTFTSNVVKVVGGEGGEVRREGEGRSKIIM